MNQSHDPTTDKYDEPDDQFVEAEYPSELRITALPQEKAQQAQIERAERWEAGEEVPAVINFQNPADLRELLTERRLELIQSVMTEPPSSMRDLATRLERGIKQVHNDVHLLEDYGIIQLKAGSGRAKMPRIPYDKIRIEIEISPLSNDRDIASEAEA